MIGAEDGVEPARPYGQQILSPLSSSEAQSCVSANSWYYVRSKELQIQGMIMDLLHPTAHHFGEQKTFQLPGIRLAIVETENSRNHIGWHCHENPYFTFILKGQVSEGTKKEVYSCSAGSLLFHSRFEPHYNIELEGNTRCFHIDFAQNYLDDLAPHRSILQGIFSIRNAGIKLACYKIFREAVISDDISGASIHHLSLEILGQLLLTQDTAKPPRPLWVGKLEEILRSGYSEKFSLVELSRELSIHPVHLSRSFSQYFHCTLGEYVRKVRVERSLAFMPYKNLSLTEIASKCGFADQSHFLRSFKRIMGVSPSTYRRLLCHRG
jgi:AraC family transcriptional regulator